MPKKPKDSPVLRAQAVLAEQNIRSVPVPVERIAKTLGAQVRYSPLDNELSGMIFIKDNTPIIGVNALHHPNRQRFTIAHEIGHLVLHRSIIAGTVHVDKQFNVLMRDSVTSTGSDEIEIQANQFAAELLMPTGIIEELLKSAPIDIDDDRPLEILAKKLRVSKQALEYRVRNL
jgi:Zn-dependent peptidase ImmA (M78 family)